MRARILLILLLFSSISSFSWAQKGSISGRILDENGLGLPGATVFIEAQNLGMASDINGLFTLVNVPEGTHSLKISYIGYENISQEVDVKAGESTELSITMKPGVLIGEDILVLGDRLKGQAKALNTQRTNQNITNVIAADQIGRFPDSNVGEALRRVSGITMQNDQGEARNIIIRGLSPQLNSVMINGDRVPSAEGDNRNIQMDLIPADMIQTIQVNKAVTPDMDGDAIGGAVNLITRVAPSGLRISGTAASGYNFIRDNPTVVGNIILGNRFLDDKLGVIIGASYNDQNYGSDNFEPAWTEDEEGAYIEEFDIRRYDVQRIRRSFSASLDYKINANNSLIFRSMYNWRDDFENRYRYRITDIERDGEGGFVGELRRQTKGGQDSDRIKNARLEDQRVLNYSLNGEHLIANNIKLSWMGSFARAFEQRPRERYMRYAVEDVPLSLDLSNPEFPLVSPISTPSLSSFELDELTEQDEFTEEKNYNARIDLEIPLNVSGEQGFIKLGARYRRLEKLRDNSFTEYEPLNGDLDNLSLVPNSDFSDPDYLAGSQYRVETFATPEFLGSLDLNNSELFAGESDPSEFLGANYRAQEDILGAYVMWNQNINDKLSILAGLRLEHTRLDYTGNEFEDEENFIGEVNNTDSYTNFMPGIHLKYNVNEDMILRAAWTNTIARPNYFDLVPFRDVRVGDAELIVGNPELSPTTSMNFDIMFENYFKSVGIVSGGVFYKRVNDFIYRFTDNSYTNADDSAIPIGEEWDFFQPFNGGDADIFGFELAFQRQLDFLPGIFKGFGVYFNYTYTNSSTTGIRNEDGDLRDSEDLELPGTAPHLFNASLSYESKKLVLRASLNFAADYLDELGGDAFEDRFYDRQIFLDINASYAIIDQLRIFVEATNLTNQELRYYQGIQSRTQQSEFYGARLTAGIKFDLFK